MTLAISSVPLSVFSRLFAGIKLSFIVLEAFGNKKLNPLTVALIVQKYFSGLGQSTSTIDKDIVLGSVEVFSYI